MQRFATSSKNIFCDIGDIGVICRVENMSSCIVLLKIELWDWEIFIVWFKIVSLLQMCKLNWFRNRKGDNLCIKKWQRSRLFITDCHILAQKLWDIHENSNFSSKIKQNKNAKKRNISQPAGFEPARGNPIGFRVQRLNHSATTAYT